jgi:MarR family transcriptional repressor of emrRAB
VLSPLSREDRAALARILEQLLVATTHERLEDRALGLAPVGGYTCRMCDFGACGRDGGLCPVVGTAASSTQS